MTVYYIDRYAGSDAAAGTSEAGAWQNPSKLGTLSAGAIQPGDSILLKRGGRWSGASGFLTLILQGAEGSLVPIKVGTYGRDTDPAPIIGPGGASPQPGIITVDGSSRVDVYGIEVDGESQAGLLGISHNHTLAINLAATIGVFDCYVHDCGLDGILTSCEPAALEQPTEILRNVVRRCRRDGVSWFTNRGIRVVGNDLSDIGAGAVSPIDAGSGDAITGHYVSADCYVGFNKIRLCVDGLHLINEGEPTCIIEGNDIASYARTAMTLDDLAPPAERRQYMIRANLITADAAATGFAAVVLGSYADGIGDFGNVFDVYFWNNAILNDHATAPSVSFSYFDDAGSDASFVDVRNNLFLGAGKYVRLVRRLRTPTVAFAGNHYQADVSGKWINESTDRTLAQWQSDGFDADATTGAGVTRGTDWANDPAEASPVVGSAIHRAGAILSPDANPTAFGASRLDRFGRAWPLSHSWDKGAVAGPEAAMLAGARRARWRR